MEVVLLGLKNRQGNLFVYNPELGAVRHQGIQLHQPLTLDALCPFPFNTFGKWDASFLEQYEPTYLRVQTDLTPAEDDGMTHGNVRTYRFFNREVVLLEEFHTPFTYAWDQLKKRGEQLGTYGLTTWVLHDETRSEEEYQSMCNILTAASQEPSSKGYALDISLSRYVLPYLEHLKGLTGRRVTFCQGGSFRLTREDLASATLSPEAFLLLLEKSPRLDILVHFSGFTNEFYTTYIAGTKQETRIMQLIDEELLHELAKTKFDVEALFPRYYEQTFIRAYEDSAKPHTFLTDRTYKPCLVSYDPYENYCCAECDGYEIDEEDVAYEYEEDRQVLALHRILLLWGTVLTASSLPCFEEWSPDIFKRYEKTSSGHPFVALFLNQK